MRITGTNVFEQNILVQYFATIFCSPKFFLVPGCRTSCFSVSNYFAYQSTCFQLSNDTLTIFVTLSYVELSSCKVGERAYYRHKMTTQLKNNCTQKACAWSVTNTFVSKILRNIMNLHVGILKKIIYLLSDILVREKFPFIRNFTKNCRNFCPIDFSGYSFFFWNLCPEAEKKFLNYKIAQVLAKKMFFCRSFQRSIRIEVYSTLQRSVGAFKFRYFPQKHQKKSLFLKVEQNTHLWFSSGVFYSWGQE